MNQRGLKIAIILFMISCVFFSMLLMSLSLININEEYQVQGIYQEINDKLIFVFHEFENSFHEYDLGDLIEFRQKGTSETFTGIIQDKNKLEKIYLKEGDVYEYIVRITNVNKINIDNVENQLYISSKEKKTMIDLLLSETLR